MKIWKKKKKKIWFFEITVKLIKLLAQLATEKKTTGTDYQHEG